MNFGMFSMPRKWMKPFFLLFLIVIGLACWLFFSQQTMSRIEAEQIAARMLMGKSHFSPEIPVEVKDTGKTYEVFFTFKVPEGMDDMAGNTYKSYAIVHKKSGEVLEHGILPPTNRK